MPLLCCAPSRRLLLGKQSGRTVEVCNSFELKYTAGEGGAGVAVEQTFMEERTRQYKDVFKNLVYGWVVACLRSLLLASWGSCTG